MARLGRGLSRVIDPTAKGQEEAIAFAGSLRSPVLTDISVDWGDLDPSGVTPAFIPDLFQGDSIRVQGKFKGGAHRVEVHGRVNGRPVTMPLDISAVATPGGEAIPLIWARSRIDDYMRELTIPAQIRRTRLTDRELEQEVTARCLQNSLVTQWTSFVAVSQRIANPTTAAACTIESDRNAKAAKWQPLLSEALDEGRAEIAFESLDGGPLASAAAIRIAIRVRWIEGDRERQVAIATVRM